MYDLKVVYEESGEDYQMLPMWMIVDGKWNWQDTIYFDVQTPFERLTFDEIDSDSEQFAVTVPDTAYARHADVEHLIGVVLPYVRIAAYKLLDDQPHYDDFDLSSIGRLVLRISDIEDTLQYDVRRRLKW